MIAWNFVGDWPEQAQTENSKKVLATLIQEVNPVSEGVINLKAVDDAAMTDLNKQYSGNSYATDVLTFNYTEDGEPVAGDLGDIVINLDAAQRQAEAAGTPLSCEVALLSLHGTLHVLGYDHQKEDEKWQIDKLQSNIMKKAGLEYRDFGWEH